MTYSQHNITLITGAASGIGREIARVLSGSCERLVLIDRREDKLRTLATELGTSIEPIVADLGQSEDIERIARTIDDMRGKLDLLINNAGVSEPFSPAWQTDGRQATDVFTINYLAPMELTKRALKSMIPDNRGTIINVCSTASFFSLPFASDYAASKAALFNYSLSVYHELRLMGAKTRIKALCPGYVSTDIMNNPDRIKEHALRGPGTDLAKIAGMLMDAAIERGLAPSKVADTLIGSLDGDRFLIFTSESDRADLTPHFNALASGLPILPALPTDDH